MAVSVSLLYVLRDCFPTSPRVICDMNISRCGYIGFCYWEDRRRDWTHHLCIINLMTGAKVSVLIHGEAQVGFYGEMMIISTPGEGFKTVCTRKFFEAPSLDLLVPLPILEEGFKTDLSRLGEDGALMMGTRDDVFLQVNLTTSIKYWRKTATPVRRIIPQTGLKISDVHCVHTLGDACVALHLDGSEEIVAHGNYRYIIPSSSEQDNIRKAAFVAEDHIFVNGERIENHELCSMYVVRLYKDIFITATKGSRDLAIRRIVVP